MISLTIIDVHSATLSSLSGPRITIFAHHQATPAAPASPWVGIGSTTEFGESQETHRPDAAQAPALTSCPGRR